MLAIADCTNASGNDAWPSMAELCRKTRLSERGVQKGIRRCEELGELHVSKNAGRGRTNRYRIIMQTPNVVRGNEARNPEPRSPRTGFAPEQGSPKTPNVVRETPNHVHPEPEEPEVEPEVTTARPASRKRSAEPAGDPAFDRFWQTYPKRVAKPAAIRAWKAAMKRKADPEQIILAARRYATDPQRRESGDKYTAYPATWLNNERYADESALSEAAASGRSVRDEWKYQR
jgi:hypothetical protein